MPHAAASPARRRRAPLPLWLPPARSLLPLLLLLAAPHPAAAQSEPTYSMDAGLGSITWPVGMSMLLVRTNTGVTYVNNMDVSLVVRAPATIAPTQRLSVTVVSFTTEGSWDYFSIYGTASTATTPLVRTSGVSALSVGTTYASTDTTGVAFRFTSDSSQVYAGVVVRVAIFTPPSSSITLTPTSSPPITPSRAPTATSSPSPSPSPSPAVPSSAPARTVVTAAVAGVLVSVAVLAACALLLRRHRRRFVYEEEARKRLEGEQAAAEAAAASEAARQQSLASAASVRLQGISVDLLIAPMSAASAAYARDPSGPQADLQSEQPTSVVVEKEGAAQGAAGAAAAAAAMGVGQAALKAALSVTAASAVAGTAGVQAVRRAESKAAPPPPPPPVNVPVVDHEAEQGGKAWPATCGACYAGLRPGWRFRICSAGHALCTGCALQHVRARLAWTGPHGERTIACGLGPHQANVDVAGSGEAAIGDPAAGGCTRRTLKRTVEALASVCTHGDHDAVAAELSGWSVQPLAPRELGDFRALAAQ